MTTEIILAGVLGWILGIATVIAFAVWSMSMSKGNKGKK